MQQTALIAAMIAAYVEAGLVYVEACEPAEDDTPLPEGLSAGAARAAYVTANLAVVALWPVLFLASKLLALTERD
ncbi:MAG TPA: hypothetical protein VHL98_18725 [Microvirga sp.]|jgi:hypothetical protein|nr:hypothetical protein [Microvirga sp.]